ncbi:MAG TPA: type II toxin-antitoxin system VapC family toxin, partial [Thermomicrobiales bacterium]|nr:type II toxin-antitoxin system VapC family toxin [Thermomicrobiales bacterium]
MTDRLYMLDTDTASYWIKGVHRSVLETISSIPRDQICISVVTRAEILIGLKNMASTRPDYIVSRRFLRDVVTKAWDNDVADVYADIHDDLRRRGELFGERDVMIAAHAIALGATLVTNNTRHFARIAPPL